MLKILIVEDDEAIANLIYVNLMNEGYRCVRALDGAEGADYMEKEEYDLILLDIMLPRIDGYELLEYVKLLGTPVIFLTAKGSVEDKIKGLRLGADDYIVKPFQIGELLARVEAVLRRYGKSQKELKVGDIFINTHSRQVEKNGELVELTVKEFDLLVELVRNKNVVLSRDRLYEKVWEEPFLGETRTLDTHIRRLRKKLELEEQIKTVFRIGYRLEG
ncbi:MAG: response regulator transcription factor [Lachnospiraceae bacterium]|nr:response regulator transcription factor [Lachnospiraceae bacterium]